MQVKGFETALNLDLLKCNVKFIFEGEEEIGSPSLEAFCRTHKELLEADVILVMKDGNIIEKGNHEELMAQNGFYTNLYNSQFAH